MANTKVMTGYTYIPVIVFLQLLLGLNSHLRKVLKNVEECMFYECHSYDYSHCTFNRNLVASNYAWALTYTDIHTGSKGNIFITLALMANTNIMTGYTYIAICNYIFCNCCLGYHIQLSGLKPWLALIWLCHCRYNAMPINRSHHHVCSLCLTIKYCFLHPWIFGEIMNK